MGKTNQFKYKKVIMEQERSNITNVIAETALSHPKLIGLVETYANLEFKPQVDKADKEALWEMDKKLKTGSGIMFFNHGGKRDYGQYMAAVWAVRQLPGRKNTGMVINARFESGEGMNAAGKLVVKLLERWKIEPIMIDVENNDPVSYLAAIRKCSEILSQPGGLVVFYPEGKEGMRDETLTHGAQGAMLFGEKADWSIAGATYEIRKGKVKLKIGTPADNKKTTSVLIEQSGRKEARKAYRDLIMGEIASLMPQDLRGFWRKDE